MTAVEYLIETLLELDKKGYSITPNVLRKAGKDAKELERKQIENAYIDGITDFEIDELRLETKKRLAENYFNENYKNDKQ